MTTEDAQRTATADAGRGPGALPPVHEAWLPREHSLYRPRHGPRQRVALACAALFFAAPVLALGAGVRPAEFENRALTSFPSPVQGWSFFPQLSQWSIDHLPFREQAVHLADSVSRGVFGEAPVLDQAPKQGPVEGPIQTLPDQRRGTIYPRVVEGRDGWLYLGAEVESHCVQSKPLVESMAELRRLRDGVVASGRRFVVVIAPDKTTVVPEHLSGDTPGLDCMRATTEEFWRAVSAEDYIVDLRPDLEWWESRLGAPVYGPVDAHWSDEGGVSMAKGLVERLSPGTAKGWRVEPGSPWRVPADLPPLLGRTGETAGRHYLVMPDGARNQARGVPGDFTAPLNLSTASGPGTYPGRVGLLGDSFTYRALRYLAAAFQDITVFTHNSIPRDDGRTAGDILADKEVVAVEVAERTLVSGNFGLLKPQVVDNIVGTLSARPLRR